MSPVHVVHAHNNGSQVAATVRQLHAGRSVPYPLPLWSSGGNVFNEELVLFDQLIYRWRRPICRFLEGWPFTPTSIDTVGFCDLPTGNHDSHDSAYPAVAFLARCLTENRSLGRLNLVISATFDNPHRPRPGECFTAHLAWPQAVEPKVRQVRQLADGRVRAQVCEVRQLAEAHGCVWAMVLGAKGCELGGVDWNPPTGEAVQVPPNRQDLEWLNGVVLCDHLCQLWDLLRRGKLATL